MRVAALCPNVFDAGLPTISYDYTDTPADVYPRIQTAQQHAAIALGPYGPEALSYELVRAVLRDAAFPHPARVEPHGPGHHLRPTVGQDRQQPPLPRGRCAPASAAAWYRRPSPLERVRACTTRSPK